MKKVLEQHVSLTDTHVNKFEREKDGKKICWNYRKGRCYKGHNCPLYHDGDIANAPKTSMDGPNYRNASRGPSDADIKRMIAADVEGFYTYLYMAAYKTLRRFCARSYNQPPL